MTDLTPIATIISIAGYRSVAEMDIGDRIKIDGGTGLMPLVIKKVADEQVMVAHYYKQQGDRMYDPAVWFAPLGNADNQSLDAWTPIEYRHDPVLHQRDPAGIALAGFLPTWMSNIQSQGYLQRAREEYQDNSDN